MLPVVFALMGGCGQPRGRVASVNGEPVLEKDLEKRVDYMLMASQHMARDVSAYDLKGQVLDDLIRQRLLLQEARRRRIAPRPADVDRAYAALVDDLKKSAFGGKEKEMWRALQAAGIGKADLRAMVVDEATVSKLQEQVAGRFTVADEEVRAYYLKHEKEMTRPEGAVIQEMRLGSESDAVGALAALRRGEDFAAVAEKYLSGSSALKDAVQPRIVARGSMDKDLESVFFALRPGQVSGVVRSHYALHIFRLQGRLPGFKPRYEDVREGLRKRLLDEKRDRAVADLIAELEQKARVERYF